MRLPFTRVAITIVFCLLTTAYLYVYISIDAKSSERHEDARSDGAVYTCPPPLSMSLEDKVESLPGVSHEILLRRTINLIRESGYLMNSAYDAWSKAGGLPSESEVTMTRFNEILRLLEANAEGLGLVDGAAAAKQFLLTRLGETLQTRLHNLQNPSSCTGKKFLVVDINKPCGFGCQLHHLVHCFVLAYANNRILVMSGDRWSYSEFGFDSVFEPISNCTSVEPASASFSSESASLRSLRCPIVEAMRESPPYVHPAVPTDLFPQLSRVHGAPHVWFVGQFLAYVLRLKKGNISKSIEHIVTSLHRSPVVGIHVRRTDKIGTEAQFHELDEYMFFANQYFNKTDAQRLLAARKNEWLDDELTRTLLKYSERRFFLATDDPNLLAEARRKYSDSMFIGDSTRAQSAQTSSRSSHAGLLSILTDVIALSETDFLVCTFSSQVCRLAYELMQTHAERLGDASARFHSLDDVYYYGGQQEAPYEVIVPDKEAGLNVGDLVTFHGNHWNGLAKVSKLHSLTSSFVPAYKFQQRPISVPFGPHLHND